MTHDTMLYRDMELPPARGLKPSHPNRNVQKVHTNFYVVKIEFCTRITCSIMQSSQRVFLKNESVFCAFFQSGFFFFYWKSVFSAFFHQNVFFGSFGLSTKEPYTIMNCPSCVILHHWHRHWCRCLCTPPPGTGLDIETSYLIHVCTCVPHICTSNI